MPEENNMQIVVQTPLNNSRYVIDGLDVAAQDDSQDDAVIEPARLSDRTTRFCLFCLIPTLGLACIFIFGMDMIALKRSDNNGLPAGVNQKEGATMTPADYYRWIAANQKKQVLKETSGNNDAALTAKNHIWTWVGATLLASSILLLLLAKAILMLKKKCSSCSSAFSNQPEPSTSVVTISSKNTGTKSKKKKHHYHQTNNGILMGSLAMAMMGSYIIFMDQVALAHGSTGHPITDHAISCLLKDSTKMEYLTSCQIETVLSSQACHILKADCQDHICQHLIPNATDVTQPPKLDNICYYPNPAEPPCMQKIVTCSDMYALPTDWDMKIVLSLVISFIALIFFGMIGLLYHMSRFHLTMLQSLWAEGVASKHYLTEADGHPKPTWGKLMKETYCLWATRLYQPYFQMPWICMQCFAGPSPAFADDNDDNDDIPEEDRHLAEDDSPESQPTHNHPPLSDTSNTSSSSAGEEQAANGEERGACGNVGWVQPRRRVTTDGHTTTGHQQQASVAQHWKSDQHLEDGRQALKNSNFLSIDLSDEEETCAQQHVNNNSNVASTTCLEEIVVVLNGDSHDDGTGQHKDALGKESNTEGNVCGHLWPQGTNLAKMPANIPPKSVSDKDFAESISLHYNYF